MEIKVIFLENGKMVIMDPAGILVKCPTPPAVKHDDSGSDMPTYDEDTNTFVCGTDEADVALEELLNNLLENQKQEKLPEIIILEPAGQSTAIK